MDFHTIYAHVYLQVLTDKKKFLCTRANVEGVIATMKQLEEKGIGHLTPKGKVRTCH